MATGNRDIIVSDARILGGIPVFAGTRVPVDTLVTHLKAGDSIDEFLADFPSVSRKQVEAFLELGAELASEHCGDANSD